MTKILITPNGDFVSNTPVFNIEGTTVVIDHDTPIPTKPRLPYDAMSIGDSFTIPLDLRSVVSRQIGVLNKRQGGRRFIYRTYGDTVRIWRVS